MSQKECDHARLVVQRIPQLGGPPLHHSHAECALKQQGDHARVAVYDALFKRGLEGSMLTNVCPVAAAGRWAECPFFDYQG